ncbi:MAG: M24 family metallopeptidase [Methanotrichaceae archaeon]
MISLSDRLNKFLSGQMLDGLLFVGDSFCDLDIYYLSRFFAPDRFALLAADSITILVSSMEQGRAIKESRADHVERTSDYDILEKLHQLKKPEKAYASVLKEFLRDHNVKKLGVIGNFPVGTYQYLVEEFSVSIVESPVSEWRSIKTAEEIKAIRSTQRSNEAAMKRAIDMISRSHTKGEILELDGKPLTSERVRSAIDMALLEHGCEATDTIVAGGLDAADPHCNGTGPLPANAPIVIDIFPRSKSTRYFADMTRTVLKGEADPEIMDIYEAVLEAQKAGLDSVRAGTTGAEVHAKVCDVFVDRGYPEREGRGFVHSTGHGVGLEIHERPNISEIGENLDSGNVVTVEPGLYYPELGGVRLEDIIVVTENGCDNLTTVEKRLVL